jgi:hypothetical protein
VTAVTPVKLTALVLAGLAAAKIGMVEHLHHAAAQDAVIVAYGHQAVEACQKIKPIESLAADATSWTRPHGMRLQLGDRRHGVGLWQVDHALWADRYRKTYLVLTAGRAAAPELCTFDIAGGTATVSAGPL